MPGKNLLEVKAGLTLEEAKKRLVTNGPNIYWEKKGFDFVRFIREEVLTYFNLILFGATVISFLGGGTYVESTLILFFLLVSLFISLISELNFHHLYSKLQTLLAKKVLVIRSGKSQIISAEELVVGDAIYLTKGEKIPADCKILTSFGALCDESILTGESVPISKKKGDILYAGSEIIEGECEAEVTATGQNTQFAHIGHLAMATTKRSAYQKELDQFTRYLIKVTIFFVSFIFLLNFILKGTSLRELLVFSFVLGISIIPEFLPPITASALAISSAFFAKKKNIIKRLSAIEDLGLIDVLCVDKTGTLTTNDLKLHSLDSSDPELFLSLVLSSSLDISQKYLSDFEHALEASSTGKTKQTVSANLKRMSLVNRKLFDPHLRFSQSIISWAGKKILVVVGAPESVIRHSALSSREKLSWQKKISDFSQKGFRVYAVGYKKNADSFFAGHDKHELTFLGIAAFEDSLKTSAKEALFEAKEAGIAVKILTGDRAEVAEQIGLEIGLLQKGDRVITEEELHGLTPKLFDKTIHEHKVFARVRPEMKYRIVQSLQKKYQVGYLGEGINDVPVIKLANVGLVVDTAIDAAKDVADVILLEKDLRVIVDGVLLGRKVFYNILKYLKHTMSANFGNFFIIGILSVMLPFIPLTPLQILLTNFITDLPLFGIEFDRVDDFEVKQPAHYRLRELFILLVALGAVAAIFSFVVFFLFRQSGKEFVQTIIYLQTTISGILIFYSIRTNGWFFRSAPAGIMNVLVGFALFLAYLSLQHPFSSLVGLVPLSLQTICFLLCINIIYLFVNDFVKIIVMKKAFEKQ